MKLGVNEEDQTRTIVQGSATFSISMQIRLGGGNTNAGSCMARLRDFDDDNRPFRFVINWRFHLSQVSITIVLFSFRGRHKTGLLPFYLSMRESLSECDSRAN